MTAAATVTTRTLMAAMGVSHLTLYTYRKGTATKPDKLPAVQEGRNVLFKVSDVKAWAKKYNVPLNTSKLVDNVPAAADRAADAAKTKLNAKIAADDRSRAKTAASAQKPAKTKAAPAKAKPVAKKASSVAAKAVRKKAD